MWWTSQRGALAWCRHSLGVPFWACAWVLSPFVGCCDVVVNDATSDIEQFTVNCVWMALCDVRNHPGAVQF